MITIGVKILPKKEVLDVQGRAIAEVLKNKSKAIEDCLCGKFIVLKVNTSDPKEALKIAETLAQSVLCNDLVESYTVEVL